MCSSKIPWINLACLVFRITLSFFRTAKDLCGWVIEKAYSGTTPGEKFFRFPRSGKDPEIVDDKEIWAILPDNSGNVLVVLTGYYPGSDLFKYSYETDSFVWENT